jgi:lipopolysaccharide heptosyltransferase II
MIKVLVIRFSSIGDIVLTTPVLRCLKEQRPDIEVHYLTKKPYAPILSANPYVNKVHVLEGSLNETIARLRKEQFDYLIDLHHNLRTAIVKLRLGVPARSFDKLNFEKWLLVKLKINTLPPIHIVDRYLAAAKDLNIVNDGRGLEYYFTCRHSKELLLPESHRERFIAIVIGGQHATKRMPAEKLTAICRLIDQPVILLGGKEDEAAGQKIASGLMHVLNRCGQLSLDESAFLVSEAMHVITHDTGLMHIAAAFNKPITAVWGNTIPGFGMYPYRVNRLINAEVTGLKCRPCSKIGHKKCPLGHFKCMQEQTINAIAETVRTNNAL